MNEAKLISFPAIQDKRGNLTFLQAHSSLPFEIHRVFWTYDVPGGFQRGAHAYHSQEEVIIALSGSFDVIVHDGQQETKYHLNRSYFGLYVPALTWRHMENFSTNALSLHLSSALFSQEEYIRDFDEYLRLLNASK